MCVIAFYVRGACGFMHIDAGTYSYTDTRGVCHLSCSLSPYSPPPNLPRLTSSKPQRLLCLYFPHCDLPVWMQICKWVLIANSASYCLCSRCFYLRTIPSPLYIKKYKNNCQSIVLKFFFMNLSVSWISLLVLTLLLCKDVCVCVP